MNRAAQAHERSSATRPGSTSNTGWRCWECLAGTAVVILLLDLYSPRLSRNLLGAATLYSRGGVAHAMASDVENIGGAPPAIVAYVTINNKDEAKKLAASIVENKLAACVNILPGIESMYWWKGKVETDAEVLLIIKTRQSLVDALTKHVEANHPYDLPEVIAMPIVGGNDKYLKWIEESTKSET